ncbi:hypothetical protein GYMLUDRAFT_41869 [Collybiopsis luxurians FD-317 M1]|uniref:Cytochrome P450 n=1 Tax=Collybiopsis luxurians FD-317 M1 TaxID=944289 RepID=A0A0D0CIC7_9AGAR|nr:hypothetical protein GYMLUDRAFT_41869 [Collybiopsis luxurians FD-317 M1]
MSNMTLDAWHLQTSGHRLDILLQIFVVIVTSASIWTLFRSRSSRNCRPLVPSLNRLQGPLLQSWLKGDHMHVFDLQNGWEFNSWLAKEYGPTSRINGPLGRKQFYTFDPKAMYHILVKESSSFKPPRVENGGIFFGRGLLNTAGEQHRRQRKMLNPVFSIAHMRSMLPIFYDVVDQLENTLSRRVKDGPCELDLLSWMTRAALELIGQSGLGYSFDNMKDDHPEHKYSMIVKEFVPSLAGLGFGINYLLPYAVKLLPTNVRGFIMDITPWKSLHNLRDMVNYMHNLSVEIYKEKKCALAEGDEAVMKQIGRGKDLLSILMRENMKAASEDQLPESEVIAQLSTFTFAATDTTSNGVSRILHLLALHPIVQDRLRQEINEALKTSSGKRLSYDELVALPYLDAICRETLRLHPPVTAIIRKSVEDVVIPFSKPVHGTEVSQVLLPKDTRVIISILNANRSPEIWGPDATEWKPERWLSPFPESVTDSKIPGVYSHLMTFGGGSFSCIGFKFSQLEMKVVLSMLVQKFKFSMPPDIDIFWQMSLISNPIVVGGDRHPRLPLIVEPTA